MSIRNRFFPLLIFGMSTSLFLFVKTEGAGIPPPPPPPVDTLICSPMNREFENLPNRFAPPVDVLGDGTTMLLNAMYCADETVKLQVGDGENPDTDVYIWNEIYVSRDGLLWDASPLTLEGDSTDGNWIVGHGSVDSSFTDEGLRDVNFFVAYICVNNGTNWDCGCSDSTCGDGNNGKWALQTFHTPSPLMYCTLQDSPSAERKIEATTDDTIFCWVKNLDADNAESYSGSGSITCEAAGSWEAMPNADWAFDEPRQVWRAEYDLSTIGDTFTECWRNTETAEDSAFTFTVTSP